MEDVAQHCWQELQLRGKSYTTYINWKGFSLKLKGEIYTSCVRSFEEFVPGREDIQSRNKWSRKVRGTTG